MADNNSGTGLLGVLVGALVVIVVAGAVLYATGYLGGGDTDIRIEAPDVTNGSGDGVGGENTGPTNGSGGGQGDNTGAER